jgi:outer membrane protein assembly factor BamB
MRALAVCLLGLFSVTLDAADWPRFRGPNGSGVSETTGLPVDIGPAKNVIWKTALPPGYSSPVLSGDRIFLTAYEGEKLLTLALDRASGKELWRREAPRSRLEPLDRRNGPASPSAVADGKAVTVFFGDFGLISYDFDGRERWRVPLGPFTNAYGMGSSPILVDDLVVLVCDQGIDSFIAAFDAASGKPRWKTMRPDALSGHSTPALYRPASGPAQIVAPGSFRMDAYSAKTGESLWWVGGLPSEMKAGPIFGDDAVYVSGYSSPINEPGQQVMLPGYDEVMATRDKNKDGRLTKDEVDEATSTIFPYVDLDRDGSLSRAEWAKNQAGMAAENALIAFRLGGKGEFTREGFKWKHRRSIPQLPTTLLYRNVLYMINDGGILTTLDPATGTVLKQGRLRAAVDQYYASPVAADGKVFFASRTGILSVLKAGGEQEVLGVNDLDEEIAATPAIADGRIYVRTSGSLYCFGAR